MSRMIAGMVLLGAAGMGMAQAPARPPAPMRFVQPEPINFDDHVGWTQIFDGKTLTGWDGPTEVWSVEDGALVGKSTDESPSGTTNILWRGVSRGTLC